MQQGIAGFGHVPADALKARPLRSRHMAKSRGGGGGGGEVDGVRMASGLQVPGDATRVYICMEGFFKCILSRCLERNARSLIISLPH